MITSTSVKYQSNRATFGNRLRLDTRTEAVACLSLVARAMALLGAVIGVAILLACPPAYAVQISGAPGGNQAGASAASAPRGAATQLAAMQKDESSSLRGGVVQDVDAGKRVKVNDAWLDIVAGETKMFMGGTSVRPETLKTGQVIRFTLMPAMLAMPTVSVTAASAPARTVGQTQQPPQTQEKLLEKLKEKTDRKTERMVLRVVYVQ